MQYIRTSIDSLTQSFFKDRHHAEITQNAAKSFVMKAAGLLCGQLFAFTVAALLGADQWGAFSLALSVITIGSVLSNLGMDIGLLKVVAEDGGSSDLRDLYKKSFLITCATSLVIAALVYFGSQQIAVSVFSKPHLESGFRLAALAILPFSLLKLNAQTLRGVKQITKYVFLSFVARYFVAESLLLVAIFIFRLTSPVLLSFVVSLYALVFLSSYWVLREESLAPVKDVAKYKVKMSYLFGLSMPLLLASSLMFVKGWVDTIMVGIFLTETDVGIYCIALKLAGFISIILTAVNTIAAPKFAASFAKDDKDELERIVQHSTKLIFYSTIPVLLVFLVFPQQLLSLFGGEFTAGKTAFVILCLGNLFNALSGSVGYFMQMTNSQVAFQNITLAVTALGIGLNYVLIPLYGIDGAALSTAVGLVLWNLSCVLFIWQKHNIKVYYSPFS